MINYFYGNTKTGKTLSLIEIIKEKIKENKTFIISDRNEILPSIEDDLIKNHYFYFSEKNLKFNLIESIMKDGKLVDEYFDFFYKILFPQSIFSYKLSFYNKMKLYLKSLIENQGCSSIEKLYDYFSKNKDCDMEEHQYLSKIFFNTFDKKNAHKFSCNTSLLETLKEEKSCVFIQLNPYSNNALNTFLYFLLFKKTNNVSNNKMIYIMDNFNFMLGPAKNILSLLFNESYEIYVVHRNLNMFLVSEISTFKNLYKEDLEHIKIEELSKENHIICLNDSLFHQDKI